MRVCKLCNQPKETFYTYRRICADCRKEQSKQNYEKQKEFNRDFNTVQRERTLKSRSGISLLEYQKLLEKQGGVCAICKKPETAAGHFNLAVDHNHRCCPGTRSCGKCVRGLLCLGCNSAIGRLHDNPELVANALTYLKPNFDYETGGW